MSTTTAASAESATAPDLEVLGAAISQWVNDNEVDLRLGFTQLGVGLSTLAMMKRNPRTPNVGSVVLAGQTFDAWLDGLTMKTTRGNTTAGTTLNFRRGKDTPEHIWISITLLCNKEVLRTHGSCRDVTRHGRTPCPTFA